MASGDLDAAERLLWLHHRRLMARARRKVGVDWQGKIDPEDLLQEAYIDILRQIDGFQATDGEAFYRWAAHIVDHKFIDQVRRLRRRKRDVSREVGRPGGAGRMSLLSQLLPDDTTPSRILRHQDATGAMMSCIARLSEEHREVITRHYLWEQSFASIAADLGKSEDAVRRLGSRAIERLRACMGRASDYLSRAP